MNPNLRGVKGIAVCDFCGSGDHVFTKDTCPEYQKQQVILKEKNKNKK